MSVAQLIDTSSPVGLVTSPEATRRRRRWWGLAAVLACAAAYFALVSAEPLIDALLRRGFGTLPDPVFGTPLVQLVLTHLGIVAISSALTIAIGVPLAIWVTRPAGRDFHDVVSAAVDFGQVFPPIAVLALLFSALPVAIDLGLVPAVGALTLYGLLPVVSSTVAGLDAVPPAVVDAARGMGLGRWRILFTVELPLASRVILGGIRTSVIINVGTATIAAAVGAGGLGQPIFTGISTNNLGNVFEGALAVSALALLLDGALAVLTSWLAPEGS